MDGYGVSKSALPEWLDKLSEQLIEALVSPLHDKKTYGVWRMSKKTLHTLQESLRSTLACSDKFQNPATYDKAKKVFDGIGAVTPP